MNSEQKKTASKIGREMQEYRIKWNVSFAQACNLLGIDSQTLREAEKGQIIPSRTRELLRHLRQITKTLDETNR